MVVVQVAALATHSTVATEVGATARLGRAFCASGARSCVVVRGQRPRLVTRWFAHCLLHRPCILVGDIGTQPVLSRRDNTVLPQRVIDSFGGGHADIGIGVATLLLLVHVLAQSGLFLG